MSQSVVIQSFTFLPQNATINVGESITWLNLDPVTHTATSDNGAFDTGAIAAQQNKTISFAVAGSYAYHCAIHPTMKGTVTVLGPAGTTPTPPPSTPRPTLPPTAAPTAPPTTAPPSPSPSPSPSPAPSASPSPSPSPAPTPTAIPPAPPSPVAASPSRAPATGPDLGSGPGTLLAAGALAVAAALAGVAIYLYRKR